ncbi:hypothetical protein M8C21_007787, partial [Ambrosia artemisiifolia]
SYSPLEKILSQNYPYRCLYHNTKKKKYSHFPLSRMPNCSSLSGERQRGETESLVGDPLVACSSSSVCCSFVPRSMLWLALLFNVSLTAATDLR